MSTSLSANAAGRWFLVVAEYEHLGPAKTVLRAARELVLGLITLGIFMGEYDPKRFCDVLVVRRDNEEIAATFSYGNLGAAAGHAENLYSRLRGEQVFDFCRDLSISIDAVAGQGSDRPQERDTLWRPIRKQERRRRSGAG